MTIEDGPFSAGEVSFHAAQCFPTAGVNRTTVPRMVLATTYFADGIRVVSAPTVVSGDWRKFIPGATPGRVVASTRKAQARRSADGASAERPETPRTARVRGRR